MADEKGKILAEQESVKKLDELVSISLNKDGTINLKLTKEQFSEAVREAIIEAGDEYKILPVCVLKYTGPVDEEETIVLCRTKGLVKCPRDMVLECSPKNVLQCPPDISCKKLRIPDWRCAANRIIDGPMINDWIMQGILIERTLPAEQLKSIKSSRT